MAEVLVEFTDPVTSEDGASYLPRACGRALPDGMWQGWVEFLPIGEGKPVRTARETTQPNRRDAEYWATGLTAVYLEGALARALHPMERSSPRPLSSPVFDGPGRRFSQDA